MDPKEVNILQHVLLDHMNCIACVKRAWLLCAKWWA